MGYRGIAQRRGTFLAAVASVISVASIVLDETRMQELRS